MNDRSTTGTEELDGAGEAWPVAVVQWPEESQRADALVRDRRLRLYLVAPDADPPIDWDGLSDWIRRPAEPRDVFARIETLQRRAERSPKPSLDDDSVLWRGRSWIALAPIEARLMRAFLQRPGAVVSRSELLAAGWPGGAASRALDPRLLRLRARIASMGLGIFNVRQRGYILTFADP